VATRSVPGSLLSANAGQTGSLECRHGYKCLFAQRERSTTGRMEVGVN
jgi:hypothetical protein